MEDGLFRPPVSSLGGASVVGNVAGTSAIRDPGREVVPDGGVKGHLALAWSGTVVRAPGALSVSVTAPAATPSVGDARLRLTRRPPTRRAVSSAIAHGQVGPLRSARYQFGQRLRACSMVCAARFRWKGWTEDGRWRPPAGTASVTTELRLPMGETRTARPAARPSAAVRRTLLPVRVQ